jgi:hypothetical protein
MRSGGGGGDAVWRRGCARDEIEGCSWGKVEAEGHRRERRRRRTAGRRPGRFGGGQSLSCCSMGNDQDISARRENRESFPAQRWHLRKYYERNGQIQITVRVLRGKLREAPQNVLRSICLRGALALAKPAPKAGRLFQCPSLF